MPETMDDLVLEIKRMVDSNDSFTPEMLEFLRDNERFSSEYEYNLLRGWVENGLRKYDDAVSSLSKAAQINPQAGWVHYRLGQAYEGLGDYGNALKSYIMAVKKKPRRADFWLSKALMEDELGMIQKAYHSLDKSVDLGDEGGWARFHKAKILLYMGYPEKAGETLAQAIKENPGEESFKKLMDDVRGYAGGHDGSKA
jgi:tetratricopeptide (TPR) repeat protein